MHIAIIGSGIAGNGAAWALTTGSEHKITVFEAADRPGGHSATVDIDYDGVRMAVDTGFIVYNDLNYPNLVQLFAHLGVATEPSDMGFSVSVANGRFEWAGRTRNFVSGLFAQKRNIVSPAHLGMLLEILRFNKAAISERAAGLLRDETLGAWLDRGRYSRRFREHYLLPMGAAIWSMSTERMLAFPMASFVAFFDNHRLLHWQRPEWRTVTGGSRRYVEKLVAPFRHRIRLGTPVGRIERGAGFVDAVLHDGGRERFDAVVLACHSDQALALLADPSLVERALLGAIGYADNEVILHRDPRLMPRRRAAWAAWNVLSSGGDDPRVAVTYCMNRLQNLDARRPVFVSLNPPTEPRPDLVFGRYSYAHPQYDRAAVAAQQRIGGIQGLGGVYYCGAWTGHGFHEDGLASGLAVAESLGAVVPWRSSEPALPLAA